MMIWIWVAVGGAFLLGGCLGMLVMAVVAAGARADQDEVLGIGA